MARIVFEALCSVITGWDLRTQPVSQCLYSVKGKQYFFQCKYGKKWGITNWLTNQWMKYSWETLFLCNSQGGAYVTVGVWVPKGHFLQDQDWAQHHALTDPMCQAQGWVLGTHSSCPKRGLSREGAEVSDHQVLVINAKERLETRLGDMPSAQRCSGKGAHQRLSLWKST